MLFLYIVVLIQLVSLLLFSSSEVLLHHLDYEITNHPTRNNEVGAVNNVPSNNNCGYNNLNDSIFELFQSQADACINLERNFWKNVETFCPIISEKYDSFNLDHFQYPMNLRILAYNLEMVYLTFDIIGNSTKLYGNWWRTYLVDKSYQLHVNGIGFDYEEEENMIEVTGRVIDHWNGTYSVFFGIPIVNLGTEIKNKKLTFTLDMTLDYLACSGYAEPLFPWKKLHGKVSYVGDFAMRLKIDIYINITASSPLCSESSNDKAKLLVAQYLCDTGYYNRNIWIPSKSRHHCSEDKIRYKLETESYHSNELYPVLKKSVDFDTFKKDKLIIFVGDSTTGQIGRCFAFKMDPCGNDQQCNRAKYSLQLCKNLTLSSRYNDTWEVLSKGKVLIDGMQVEGARKSSNLIRHLQNLVNTGGNGINQFNELIIVFNIGLHEMKKFHWFDQKSHLRSLISTLTSNEMKNSFHIPFRVIWRSTWSLHEYCYQRNDYWFRDNSILKTHTTAEAVVKLRDPTVWLHHSFILDYVYNISEPGNFTYLDTYWLSKSRVKKYSAENRQHDIRHHDSLVIRASIETILDSIA